MQLLRSLEGREVTRSSVGHGTFLQIHLKSVLNETDEIMLWVYLANWALILMDEEIIASDMDEDTFRVSKSKAKILDKMIVKDVIQLNKDELHIDFSDSYRLEIWADREIYGDNAILLRVFSGDEHLGDLTEFEGASPS